MSRARQTFFTSHVDHSRPAKVELEMIYKRVQDDILRPLETLNEHRPGNPNNESALKVTLTLCDAIRAVIHRQTETSDAEKSSETAPAPITKP